MVPGFLDLANVTAASLGTGSTILLGPKVTGWRTWAEAGAVSGRPYFYLVESPNGDRHEIGTATYDDSGTPQLINRTPFATSNPGDAILDLQGDERIFSGPVAQGMHVMGLAPIGSAISEFNHAAHGGL